MKLTVLIDNTTLIGRCFIGEPGLSFFIQEGSKQILFDVGYSDAFIANAKRLNIDLLDIDSLVLSHGHFDHTWGLEPFMKLYTNAQLGGSAHKKATLLAHSQVFNAKTYEGVGEIGSKISENELSRYFNLHLTNKPFWLTEKLVFLGEIERSNNFENKQPLGKVFIDGTFEDDFLLDDSALAYKGAAGLIVITACSHAGICNIIEYAKKVCDENRVVDVIGGFHLLEPPSEQLNNTLNYFKNLELKELHACHCVDLDSKIALAKVANLKEVGVGLSLNYD